MGKGTSAAGADDFANYLAVPFVEIIFAVITYSDYARILYSASIVRSLVRVIQKYRPQVLRKHMKSLIDKSVNTYQIAPFCDLSIDSVQPNSLTRSAK